MRQRPAAAAPVPGPTADGDLAAAGRAAWAAKAPEESRPTTAGDEFCPSSASTSAMGSRHSVRSRGWREEWTPGAGPSVPAPAPPPLLTAERVAVGAAASLARLGQHGAASAPSGRVPKPPRLQEGAGASQPMADGAEAGDACLAAAADFDVALKRLSEKDFAWSARPPEQASRWRRWPGGGAGAAGVPAPTPAPAPTPLGVAASGGAALSGPEEPRRNRFSDLALSFAALDEDFA